MGHRCGDEKYDDNRTGPHLKAGLVLCVEVAGCCAHDQVEKNTGAPSNLVWCRVAEARLSNMTSKATVDERWSALAYVGAVPKPSAPVFSPWGLFIDTLPKPHVLHMPARVPNHFPLPLGASACSFRAMASEPAEKCLHGRDANDAWPTFKTQKLRLAQDTTFRPEYVF